MTSPTSTEIDEQIKATLILAATANAAHLGTSTSALRAVTESIIGNLGTMDDDDRCRLCAHDHSIRSLEADEVTPFRPSHSDVCDCDLTQVAALESEE